MNYEKIITELGNQVAQLSIDKAVLISRVEEEMKYKEEVEAKYVEMCSKVRCYKDMCIKAGLIAEEEEANKDE